MSADDDEYMNAFDDAFLAPSPRENQQEVVEMSVDKFNSGKDVVLVDAPPGFGKSLALGAIPRMMGDSCFYVTPLNTLVKQLEEDEFMGDHLVTMKGRNNYKCILPGADEGTTVDKGKCQRESNFDCDLKAECPYYKQKDRALVHPFVVTNMSYLMASSMIPETVEDTFTPRDTLIVDECQNIEDFGMSFISFTVGKNTVPAGVWKEITVPNKGHEDDLDYLLEWLEDDVLSACEAEHVRLEKLPVLNEAQVEERDKLQQFEQRVRNFLRDVRNNDWIAQIETETRKNQESFRKAVFKPVEIGRFLHDYLWSWADKIVLSSATIPKGGWLGEIGLGNANVTRIEVPSPFPVENRPIVTELAVGKMTKDKREQNAWPMAQRIKQIADHHDGENGFVHCRSYKMAQLLKRAFTNNVPTEDGPFDGSPAKWFRDNVIIQDKYDREGSLEGWKDSDKPLFFSVNMAEGVSLDGDTCRYQILAKTLYKHMGDKRVKYRVTERNEWDWYNRHAVTQLEQAYGRGVRSKEDECVFYLLDSSAVGLIKRNTGLFHDWFLDGVTDMNVR